jgi:hypothetical protein
MVFDTLNTDSIMAAISLISSIITIIEATRKKTYLYVVGVLFIFSTIFFAYKGVSGPVKHNTPYQDTTKITNQTKHPSTPNPHYNDGKTFSILNKQSTILVSPSQGSLNTFIRNEIQDKIREYNYPVNQKVIVSIPYDISVDKTEIAGSNMICASTFIKINIIDSKGKTLNLQCDKSIQFPSRLKSILSVKKIALSEAIKSAFEGKNE